MIWRHGNYCRGRIYPALELVQAYMERVLSSSYGGVMIYLTKLNGAQIVVNADLVESIEMMPDTIISITSGKKIIVRESAEEVIEKVKQYKKQILQKDSGT